jgi:conjugal transfer pilus assembly protein TraA
MEKIMTFVDNIRNNKMAMLMGVLVVGGVLALAAEPTLAGVGGGEFDEIWDTLKDWLQGTLGRIVAGVIVLVGMVMGVARQSLMAFAVGIGGGIGLYNVPDVIEAMMTATIAAAADVAPVVTQIANGIGG